jgi:ribosomal protein S26
LRGREAPTVCESCGRKVPRNKAIIDERSISFSTDTHTPQDVRFFERRKVYYCISCAKHKGIFKKLERKAIERANKVI